MQQRRCKKGTIMQRQLTRKCFGKKNVELAKFFFLWPSANIIKWHDWNFFINQCGNLICFLLCVLVHSAPFEAPKWIIPLLHGARATCVPIDNPLCVHNAPHICPGQTPRFRRLNVALRWQSRLGSHINPPGARNADCGRRRRDGYVVEVGVRR